MQKPYVKRYLARIFQEWGIAYKEKKLYKPESTKKTETPPHLEKSYKNCWKPKIEKT